MKLLISGASGLVGSQLCQELERAGHEVVRLVRRPEPKHASVLWDIDAGRLDAEQIESFDAVIHLAGENIAGRWTAAKKAAIHQSRVRSTKLLSKTLASLKDKPRVFICASAIGAYGSRGEESLDERSPRGDGWLASVCAEWEAACDAAREAGIRVVNLRIGVVLSPDGGALAKMLTPFRLGVGGRIGSGKQWMSWVSLADVVAATRFALENKALEGPINCTAPEPTRNITFTKDAREGSPSPDRVSDACGRRAPPLRRDGRQALTR